MKNNRLILPMITTLAAFSLRISAEPRFPVPPDPPVTQPATQPQPTPHFVDRLNTMPKELWWVRGEDATSQMRARGQWIATNLTTPIGNYSFTGAVNSISHRSNGLYVITIRCGPFQICGVPLKIDVTAYTLSPSNESPHRGDIMTFSGELTTNDMDGLVFSLPKRLPVIMLSLDGNLAELKSQ